MSEPTALLESRTLSAVIDPRRGSNLLSIIQKETGTELLFATPWRDRAGDIREGRSGVTSIGSMESWLEQYRGG